MHEQVKANGTLSRLERDLQEAVAQENQRLRDAAPIELRAVTSANINPINAPGGFYASFKSRQQPLSTGFALVEDCHIARL